MARSKSSLRIRGKLEPEQIDLLLDKLDFSSLCHERLVASRRSFKSHLYRTPAVIQFTNADEDVTVVAAARNLSEVGMAFLLGGAIPPGTPCIIRLTSLDGEPVSVSARILHCRDVGGQCEFGVKFDEPIELARFCRVQSG